MGRKPVAAPPEGHCGPPPEGCSRGPEEGSYSSPPCYAAEFPGYFGEGDAPPVLDPDLVARLNALLEAERAGAKVLLLLARGLAADSSLLPVLEHLQKDEGRNAALLYKTIRRLGGLASSATGAFVEKTLAIPDLPGRLRFVNAGQAWVVRKIDEALPLLVDAPAREMLLEMRRSHLENIAVCDALLAAGAA